MISIPFRGSKKYSYKQIKKIVEDNGYKRTLEPFGGTGVLSANLLNDGLIDEAVINDYDRLFDLYPEFLDVKDAIVKECEERGLKKITKSSNPTCYYYYDDNGDKVEVSTSLLNRHDRKILQDVIAQYDSKYYQLLATGSCFCHSGVQNHLYTPKVIDFTYFRFGLSTKKAREYLKVINQCTLTHKDYKDFLKTESFDNTTLLIVDPPYIGAKVGAYTNEDRFDYETTSDLIRRVKETDSDFVFFNYGIDQIRQLLLDNNLEPTLIEYTGTASTSSNRKSRDVLAYVKQAPTKESFFMP